MPASVVVGNPLGLFTFGSSTARLLGPTVVEDGRDEVVPDEGRIEVGEHIGVHRAEGAARAVLHAVGKRLQDTVFEVRTGVCGGDGRQVLLRQIVAAETEY